MNRMKGLKSMKFVQDISTNVVYDSFPYYSFGFFILYILNIPVN